MLAWNASIAAMTRRLAGGLGVTFAATFAMMLASPGGHAGVSAGGSAGVSAVDVDGRTVRLERPAQRIVSLAPHATEMLFAIGAGARVVGAIEYSDYPEAARRIPRIGAYGSIDLERVRALAPDLVIAWASGNAAAQVDKLRALGVPVLVDEPLTIADIGASMRKLGALTGLDGPAGAAAAALLARHARLAATYGRRRPVRMFYQVWDRPLMTVNGKQSISDAMRTCGAVNVFADLPALAPVVDVEAVLAADPEIIATSGVHGEKLVWLESWRQWPRLLAVRRDNLVVLPPDLLNRMGPRMVDGVEQLCLAVDAARQHGAAPR